MAIDLHKGSTIVNAQNSIPDEIHLSVTYKVAQGKGLAAKLASKLGAKLDLDAILVAYNNRNEVISCAGPEHLDPFGGSAVHTGDAKAGGGGAATETIIVRPNAVPQAVNAFVLALVAFGNAEAFGKLSQLSFELSDGSQVLGTDYLTIERGVEGKLLYKVVRNGRNGWDIAPLTQGIGRASKWEDVADEARRQI